MLTRHIVTLGFVRSRAECGAESKIFGARGEFAPIVRDVARSAVERTPKIPGNEKFLAKKEFFF